MVANNENIITIVGNLTEDPELRFTPNGVAVTNCRVAVNRRFFNKQSNDWEDRLDGYFTVNVWRDYAENVAETFSRGDRVLVTGGLQSRSYENKEGETRWVTEIEADEVCPSLRWATAQITKVNRSGGGRDRGQTSAGQQAPPPAAPPEADDVPF